MSHDAFNTDQADRYFGMGGMEYDSGLMNQSYTTICVLPELTGKPWNNAALSLVSGLRPSRIRVSEGGVHADSVHWRVTVFVNPDKTIKRIEQEVVIDIPRGVENAWHLDNIMRGPQ